MKSSARPVNALQERFSYRRGKAQDWGSRQACSAAMNWKRQSQAGQTAALLIRPEERIPRTWEVKGNDQVCYQDTRFPGCRLFQRNKENPNEFRTAWGGFHWAEFKVEDGIPQF